MRTGLTKTNMRGSLFKYNKKERESQPDYVGNCKIDDIDYVMSAWLNTEGEHKRISISFKKIDGECEPKDDSVLF